MQIGFVGLGKMGGNMVHRIHRDSDHEVVAFDFNDDGRRGSAEGHGAERRATRSRTSSSKLEAPRMVWVMVPAGDPTQQTVDELAELLEAGDTIVDGGNTNWHDDVRRAAELDAKGDPLRRRRHLRRRLGARGRLLHDGRRPRGVGAAARPDPRRARPARRLAPLRRRGRRPLREDGPQRRRVRDDAGLRRGLRADAQVEVPDRPRGGRRPVEPRLGRPLLAVRARRARVRGRGQRPRGHQGPRLGLRRGPLDDHRRRSTSTCRRRSSPPRSTRASTRAARATTRTACSRRCATSSAGTRSSALPGAEPMAVRRRARRPTENPLVEGLERLPVPPTTLVIFGATGDLAHRKLLPALYNLAHEGALPERFKLIGVARREKGRRGLPRGVPRVDLPVLAPRARRRGARRACSSTCSTSRRTFDDPAGYKRARRGARRARRGGRPAAQPRLLPLDGAGVLPA